MSKPNETNINYDLNADHQKLFEDGFDQESEVI
jgi:hypothetical protein